MSTRIAQLPLTYVPSIVLGELYFGAFGSPSRRPDALAEVAALESKLTVLPVDAATAKIYARLKHDLKRQGFTMPDNDLWIAAIAIQYNVTLAARDAHFDWIAGLRVEQW